MSKEEQDNIVNELGEDLAIASVITEADIINKYDQGQARIIVQRNDFLVPNLIQMINNKDVLNLSPDYQRRKRWNDIKKSHLIESLLVNIPIPPIFLYESDLAQYEVMDGQQRIDAIRGFIGNEFKLKDLKKWPELNGRYFRDLPNRIQRGLERRGISATIILTESGKNTEEAMDIRQYVFERLNTGGEKLNQQEVRNCIYASDFNNMIIKISRDDLFTSAWSIPMKEPDEPQKISRKLAADKLYSTMADCEIVLRYFALIDIEQFKGGVKRTLDSCMYNNKNTSEEKCQIMKIDYLTSLQIAKDIYGDGLFKLLGKTGDLNGRRSVPLSDAVLLAVHTNKKVAKDLISKRIDIVEATKSLLLNPATYEILVGRGNTKKTITERIDMISNLFKEIIK
ncbi:DUF262 domain-containing protein [Hymenobacter lapidiphilus]|uniref:DUF262 domain-containing protein n=1 Tax=Hymenobacter lapidiphilus TaxID=2608003 RepID=A0A7Y7PLY7_9BACT|nr:DUF262 domain-containing protein [Hymenobacter lapidiphilus]NVO30243.1 DUF262 domain-containing protein [Hymenobacter lapidiphilus]